MPPTCVTTISFERLISGSRNCPGPLNQVGGLNLPNMRATERFQGNALLPNAFEHQSLTRAHCGFIIHSLRTAKTHVSVSSPTKTNCPHLDPARPLLRVFPAQRRAVNAKLSVSAILSDHESGAPRDDAPQIFLAVFDTKEVIATFRWTRRKVRVEQGLAAPWSII